MKKKAKLQLLLNLRLCGFFTLFYLFFIYPLFAKPGQLNKRHSVSKNIVIKKRYTPRDANICMLLKHIYIFSTEPVSLTSCIPYVIILSHLPLLDAGAHLKLLFFPHSSRCYRFNMTGSSSLNEHLKDTTVEQKKHLDATWSSKEKQKRTFKEVKHKWLMNLLTFIGCERRL